MKKLICGGLLALALGMAPVAGAGPITRVIAEEIKADEWGMDDGIGVGTRTAGTPCLRSESHQWAEDPNDGIDSALWCPPPAFVWIPVVGS